MKLWIDDRRKAPEGYTWCKSTNEALRMIRNNPDDIELIDLDHDAGDYHEDGGDYINILGELERLCHYDETRKDWVPRCIKFKFRIHSANSVGVANMRAIIWHNGWEEV